MKRLILISLIVLLGLPAAYAQGISLTQAQRQMLDSLPPAQRQQALDAIAQLEQQQQAQSEAGEEGATEPDQETEPTISTPVESIRPGPHARERSRLVVNFLPVPELTPEELEELMADPALSQLIGSQLFVLDDAGVLVLQGLEVIPLLGLNEEDIQARLRAEPYLGAFDIQVRILGQEPIGVEALLPFGYEILTPDGGGEQGDEFEPSTAGPVPPDYVLGPGDTVRVQLFGNVNGIYEFEVSRDGILNLPNIGPVNVAGMRFRSLREDLNERVRELLIGTQVSVTMGALRSIRVFVLGDVNRPGSYVVSGMATISAALYASGGISEVGSLRNVQLKRGGETVARLDFYDLLIEGDTSGDERLQPGDVIFVPPVGKTVAVAGAVKRPAIYEMRDDATVAEAVLLAGGLRNDAFGEGARIERIDEDENRTVLSVNVESSQAREVMVRTGDTLLVPVVLPDIDGGVQLDGHVYRSGLYPWRPGMRLTDLVTSTANLKDGVDMNYVLIRRQERRGSPIRVVSADLEAALIDPESTSNIPLQARDRVHVFSLELGRQRIVGPLLEELEMQATYGRPANHVEIDGRVRAPGQYPLESGMRISDLIRAGGNLAQDAYGLRAELARYTVDGSNSRVTEVVEIDLAAVLRGNPGSDVELSPYDFLSISQVPEWDTQWTVEVSGEVRFPGVYRIVRGETLSDIVRRAGGLTEGAFPEGAVFLREELREREREQIELLAQRLETDLTSLSLQMAAESGGADALATGQALLQQLRSTRPVGRLVIDTTNLSDEGRAALGQSIELRDGDELLVPKQTQVVTVIGETQQNTSHLHMQGLDRDDYISMSGGLTRRADKRRIYVVRANGSVLVRNRSRWLGRSNRIEILPGDTIVVPLDAEKMRPISFWTNVTQILYQAAIAIAAVQAINN